MPQYIAEFTKLDSTGGPYIYIVSKDGVGKTGKDLVTAGNLLDSIQADIQTLSPGETIAGGRLIVNTTTP